MKRFLNFENNSDKEYDFIQIEYSCFYKMSSKTFYKGSRIKSIQNARKEYKKLLEECWKKTDFLK